MSSKSRSKQTNPTEVASSETSTISNRPASTLNQLVTAHDIQLYKLTRAYQALVERMNKYEMQQQQQKSASSGPIKPTFEEETDISGTNPLEVVVEEE